MVHSDVLEFEIDFDKVFGQFWWEFDNLISKVFNKLIIDVGDPGFEPDRYVFEQEVDTIFFLQNRLELDKLFRLDLLENIGLF